MNTFIKSLIILHIFIVSAYSKEIGLRALGPSYDVHNRVSMSVLIGEEKSVNYVIRLSAISYTKFQIIEVNALGIENIDICFSIIDTNDEQSKLLISTKNKIPQEAKTRIFLVTFDNVKLDHSLVIKEVNHKDDMELWRQGIGLSSNIKLVEDIERAVNKLKGSK